MSKPNVARWLDLEPGDSIIERVEPGKLRELARRLEKNGLRFDVEPMEREQRPVLITRKVDRPVIEE